MRGRRDGRDQDERRLEGEVDGEDALLQRGEGRAEEGLEAELCHDPGLAAGKGWVSCEFFSEYRDARFWTRVGGGGGRGRTW